MHIQALFAFHRLLSCQIRLRRPTQFENPHQGKTIPCQFIMFSSSWKLPAAKFPTSPPPRPNSHNIDTVGGYIHS